MHTFIGIEFARGAAALMVLLSHYAHFITADRTLMHFFWTGVDLFFVVSGFVFSKLIFSSEINLRAFLVKRFFRIYPLYLAALILYFFLTDYDPERKNFFLKHLIFFHTTVSKKEAFFFNPAFWTLPVEVEFYLFIPFLVFISKFKKWIFFVFIISLGTKMILVLKPVPGPGALYQVLNAHLTGILSEFFLGIYLYRFTMFLKNFKKRTIVNVNIIVFILGFCLMSFLSVFFITYGDLGFKEYPLLGGWYNFLCALGYAFLLLPLTFLTRVNAKNIFIKILFFLGSISYPVYLMHNASPKLLHMIGFNPSGALFFLYCTVLTLFLAWVLHGCIEEPLRKWGRGLSGRWA
jgi:exopolysaccharide production protein ExoZ